MSGGQWGCLRVWNPTNGRCELEIRGPLDRRPTQVTGDSGKANRESIEYGLHSIVDLQIFYVKRHGDYPTALADEAGLVPKLVLVRQSNHVEFYNPGTGKLFSEVSILVIIVSDMHLLMFGLVLFSQFTGILRFI